MKSITQSELQDLFFATDKTQFVSFVSITDPAMRKRNNPHPDARKVSMVTAVINWTYSRTVNTQRRREHKRPNFKALRRKWGRKINGTPLVAHKTADDESKFYLEVKIERRHVLYFNPKTRRKISPAKLEPFLKPIEKNERQKLDREVILRDYQLTGIAELTIAGQQYRIAPAAKELLLYLAPKPKKAKAKTSRRTPSPKQPRRGAIL